MNALPLWAKVGAPIALVATAATAVVFSSGGENENGSADPVASSVPPSTYIPSPFVTNGGPAVTVTAPTEVRTDVDRRLSTDSRFGYAGLGPVLLGMTLDEASRASGFRLEMSDESDGKNGSAYLHGDPFKVWPDDAGKAQPGPVPEGRTWGAGLSFGVRDGRIVRISTASPAFSTISGIRVGQAMSDVMSTYSNAQPTALGRARLPAVTITNAQGNVVVFYGRDYVTNITTLASIEDESVYGI